jgi:hypothetical protein
VRDRQDLNTASLIGVAVLAASSAKRSAFCKQSAGGRRPTRTQATKASVVRVEVVGLPDDQRDIGAPLPTGSGTSPYIRGRMSWPPRRRV